MYIQLATILDTMGSLPDHQKVNPLSDLYRAVEMAQSTGLKFRRTDRTRSINPTRTPRLEDRDHGTIIRPLDKKGNPVPTVEASLFWRHDSTA